VRAYLAIRNLQAGIALHNASRLDAWVAGFLSVEAEKDARARELGALACLEKPFDAAALTSLIANTLNRRAEGAQA
jgi:DNA-binding response OmpR family regulator